MEPDEESNYTLEEKATYGKIKEYVKNVVFVTSDTAISTPSVIDEMKEKGLEPIVVPETLVNKIDDYNQGMEEDTKPILTTNKYIFDMAEKNKLEYLERFMILKFFQKQWDCGNVRKIE